MEPSSRRVRKQRTGWRTRTKSRCVSKQGDVLKARTVGTASQISVVLVTSLQRRTVAGRPTCHYSFITLSCKQLIFPVSVVSPRITSFISYIIFPFPVVTLTAAGSKEGRSSIGRQRSCSLLRYNSGIFL